MSTTTVEVPDHLVIDLQDNQLTTCENPFVKRGCKGMIEIMKGNGIMLRIDLPGSRLRIDLPGNDLEFTKEGGRLVLTATEDNDVDFTPRTYRIEVVYDPAHKKVNVIGGGSTNEAPTFSPPRDLFLLSSRMASNTLKDLNSLPLTEKMSDCKASLAKPCVGKMNGPLLPSSVALPPSVGESEKPEAEKATVEVEYIESENLDNVDDADAVLKSVLAGLDSKDWVSVCDALNNVRRLSIFHKEAMLHMLEKVIPLVVKSLKNPRSAVCKTACMTSADIFSAYNDHITDLLDSLLTQLLLKSSQDKRFVCEAAEKALTSMTKYVSPTLLLPKLQPCLKNRNPRIRAKASSCFSRSVPRLGVEGIKEYGIDKLVQAAASQLSDQLPESREAARIVLLELQTVYEKAHPLIKPETSSSSSPEEEQISEAEPITWENFCQSKLSALSAQAVLRVTNVLAMTAREGLVTTGSSSTS
ncbi:unnamed protein product [Brassica rapa subsp. trilocularis]